ncbi:MAG: molybdopterin-dependent oxidoreductase [Desulforhopalus sp.]
METIALTINGKKISCAEGNSILQAAEAHGIKIPKLCYHHSLKPFGACRLCLVEEQESGRLFASCVTPATQDMVLVSDSPQIKKHRRNIVSLMMAEHPESCIVCNKGNRCHLRMIAAELGIAENRLYPMPNHKPLEQANPFIMRDLSKCILCGKCIRADHELVCAGAIDYNMRGFSSRPATLHELPLEESSCTFCGTCVSICPTGALAAKDEFVSTPERETNSICGFCGVGCNLMLAVAGNQIVGVNPSHIENSVNDATLCVRGHFAHDFLNSSQRLTKPLVRKENELVSTSWEDALETTARRLLDIKKLHGPESIAFIGSSKCSNEENYLFQKIARTIIETNNLDNGGYLSGRLFLDLVEERSDKAGRFNFFAGPFSGLEQAEAIFVIGAEPAQSAPVLDYYLKRSAKKGIPLVVVHPRKTDLASSASVWLNPYGSTVSKTICLDTFYLELLNVLSVKLLLEKSVDNSFLSRFTSGYEEYKSNLLALDRKASAEKANLDIHALEAAVDLLNGKKITFVVGDGLMLQRYGKEVMEALLNLALMTGSIGYRGAGFHVLSKENNLVGSWDMGTVPDALPGRLMILSDNDRIIWEKAWKSQIPKSKGLDLFQMMKKAEEGKLKAVYFMGENPLRSLPQPDRLFKSLQSLEFIVAQDILVNETVNIADVVLPGAAFSEKAGSFTNMEGKIQCFSPAVDPPGNAKSDLEILGLVAEKMGSPKYKVSHDEIRKEISSTISAFSDTTACKHPIWIRERGQEQKSFIEKQIHFSPVTSSKETVFDNDYPFTALFGSLRFHLGSGTRTEQSARIGAYDHKGEIEVSPMDADKMNLNQDDLIKVASTAGAIERNIKINRNMQTGFIYIPTAFNNNDARCLIHLMPLLDSSSNGWDSCRVSVEKVTSR